MKFWQRLPVVQTSRKNQTALRNSSARRRGVVSSKNVQTLAAPPSWMLETKKKFFRVPLDSLHLSFSVPAPPNRSATWRTNPRKSRFFDLFKGVIFKKKLKKLQAFPSRQFLICGRTLLVEDFWRLLQMGKNIYFFKSTSKSSNFFRLNLDYFSKIPLSVAFADMGLVFEDYREQSQLKCTQ